MSRLSPWPLLLAAAPLFAQSNSGVVGVSYGRERVGVDFQMSWNGSSLFSRDDIFFGINNLSSFVMGAEAMVHKPTGDWDLRIHPMDLNFGWGTQGRSEKSTFAFMGGGGSILSVGSRTGVGLGIRFTAGVVLGPIQVRAYATHIRGFRRRVEEGNATTVHDLGLQFLVQY